MMHVKRQKKKRSLLNGGKNLAITVYDVLLCA